MSSPAQHIWDDWHVDRSPRAPVSPASRLRVDPTRYAGFVRSAGWFAALLAGVAVAASLIAQTFAGATPIPELPAPPVSVSEGIGIFRVLLDVSIVAAIGVALLGKFLGFDDSSRTEPVMRSARRWGVRLSWLWILSALVSVVLLSAEVYPNDFPRRSSGLLDLVTAPMSFLQYVVSSPELIGQYVRGVPAGKGLLVTAGLGLLSVWICRRSLRSGESVPAELRAGVAAFALLPLPLTGHASPWKYHDLVMISMELHVLAAAAWAGGLAACLVFLVRRPGLLAVALPRFSRLATLCVFVVAVSGVFSGIAMLATSGGPALPEAIWTTHYGQLTLVKLACIGLIGVVALTVRRGMLTRIADSRPTAIAVWCGFELMIMAVAFGVAVILTRSAPF